MKQKRNRGEFDGLGRIWFI